MRALAESSVCSRSIGCACCAWVLQSSGVVLFAALRGAFFRAVLSFLGLAEPAPRILQRRCGGVGVGSCGGETGDTHTATRRTPSLLAREAGIVTRIRGEFGANSKPSYVPMPGTGPVRPRAALAFSRFAARMILFHAPSNRRPLLAAAAPEVHLAEGKEGRRRHQ
eukprot:364169-Chlamydomonas_euryale.AAC.4